MSRVALALGVGLAVVLFGSTGCLSAGDVLEQLKDDPATVCASYIGMYGNLQVSRTAAPNAKVTCSKDGLTVETVKP